MRLVTPIVFALALVGLAGAPGCAAKRLEDRRPLVTRVVIEGNEVFKDSELLPSLAQRAIPWWYWVPPGMFLVKARRLDDKSWAEDQTRLANIYALRGYFDARVQRTRVEFSQRKRPDGTPRYARVFHLLEEGPASELRQVRLELTSRLDEAEAERLRQHLESRLDVKTGDTFSMQPAEELRSRLLEDLYARSFARSRVQLMVDAHPDERSVDLGYEVEVGAPAVFGKVRVQGLETVKEKHVRRAIRIREGEVWSASRVRKTQRAIYRTGLFSMVTVSPEMKNEPVQNPDGLEIVPVDVLVRERKPQTLEIGGGAGWDLGRVDAHVALRYAHINLWGERIRGDGTVKLGFAWINREDMGPIGKLDVTASSPDWPFRTLTPQGELEVDLEVERGYKMWSPSGSAGFTWSPLSPLRVLAFYQFAYVDLFPDSELLELDADALGDFPDNYLLSILKQTVLVDLRDDPLTPAAGFLGRVSVDESFRIARRGFQYIKLDGELRGYVAMVAKRLVIASRLWSGAIFSEDGNVPSPQRLYAGGDGSVRGWRSRYLGPREEDANCDRRDCTIPTGGFYGLTASLELRGRVWRSLWLSAFVEAGRVWASLDEPNWEGARFLTELQPSLGGGVRYDTSFGRIRLDFAIHPNDWTDTIFQFPLINTPRGQRTPGNWNVHLGIGESF
jgi:outer membrane protein assembly factor BamA